jgi:hypothetical protein
MPKKVERRFRGVTACFGICDLEFGIFPGIWVLGIGILKHADQ